jgi:hypothetical protein
MRARRWSSRTGATSATRDPTSHAPRKPDMAIRFALLAIPLALTISPGAIRTERTCHGVTDGWLCMPLPRGWHSSVGPGVASGRWAAWILAGNFAFPPDRAKREGLPSVPPGKLVISIGDFPVLGSSRSWRRARRLELPARDRTSRELNWRVRFLGRALNLTVRFGSTPTPALRNLANQRLAAVRRDD